MTDLSQLKAFRSSSEDEDYLIVLGATTAAQFRAAAVLAGLIREHAHIDGYEHDEPMQAHIVQREDEQQQMVWDCKADADDPGAQLGMAAITYWAEADTFDKEADPAAQSIEALALALNRVLHPAVHSEYLGALQKLRA